ncbi:hypothetical protein OB955_12955 [Halobacteria archaeon AArc-m2/3/4]|uniref:DUF8159 domain-containing protein n=1 Tax=Natronoglomus mannanivorans TaxID=2979990 RepID=A0AAP3E1G2_9EURY|nr:hypothetical protein [Halobacteria archaeon AArc-xg1-1]MCU4973643.1 hypothetical protein [Halobacteria archaeon AArc-m2/3/4]
MDRRHYLATGATVLGAGLAGCFNTSDEEHARSAVDGIETELGVDLWDLEDDTFVVDFYTSRDRRADIRVVATAYAESVADGFDHDAAGWAVDEDDGEPVYSFDIDLEWAQAFNGGERSEDEYLDRIEETIENE